ncbi:MAG: cation:proton antiporter [Hyphomicrobiales bacterium]
MAAAGGFLPIVVRRLPLPFPVLLLAVGLIAGPDITGVIDVSEFRDLARIAISLAVATIVFEGSMAIRLGTLRALGPVVRNMVVLGLVVTPVVAALAAHYLLDFDWRVSFLFGALVSVTGPTVITPLLRSIRVNDRIKGILSAEAVIIDPFGALLTLFLLQLVLAESLNPAAPASWAIGRILAGTIAGASGAAVVYLVARSIQRLTGREVSLVIVGGAVATFATVESLFHESGLTAMVVMGLTVGNLRIPHKEAAIDFQESVVTFLTATVYVLLAASVDLGDVRGLGWRGLAVVLVLVLIGRPLLVWVASFRSDLNWREKTFLSAVAPRGVVAASLASVVAVEVQSFTNSSGQELVALVFIVIALTIAVQSAYAGPLSRLLGVEPMTYVVAGSGNVGRRVAARLAGTGNPVLLVEGDEQAAIDAREEGFDVLIGNIADPAVQKRAGIDDAQALVLATGDDATNLLAAQHARKTGCAAIYTRVNLPENLQAFEDLGVSVVNPAEATAAELAHMVAPPLLEGLLASTDEDITAARIRVTNALAQRSIESLAELRGTLAVLVRRGQRSFIPDGKTFLQLGDEVTIVGPVANVARARGRLAIAPLAVR